MAQKTYPSGTPLSPWQVVLRLRWPLGGTIALAFALGQLAESLVFGTTSQQRLVLDVIGWGLLGGLAVWFSLTWAGRQEQRYQRGLGEALREQQELNRQLQRANSQLALLSEVNRHIVESATLDDVLNAALRYGRRLVQTRAAALVLDDNGVEIMARVDGASEDEIAVWRAACGTEHVVLDDHQPRLLPAPADLQTTLGACLLVPLDDGTTTLGRIELYLLPRIEVPADELALLQTIASEIAEAIISSRRRSLAERSMYELERAIADERARIARDIHDGIAQTLAFRRMRIDLWLDWIESDPERLRAELIENKQILREQIGELRRAIFALRPVQFDQWGFVGGLHRYIVEFANQHDWTVHVHLAEAPPTLTPDVEAVCFRVVQEALTNITKHARASEVDVAIDTIDGGLRVRVRDNGVGFEPGKVSQNGGQHVGLRQMQERLHTIRGQLTVLSQPGAGTELRAWIPLPTQQGATYGTGAHRAGR